MTTKWTMTNGEIAMRICASCGQPYREGHINCSCDENHPDPCARPTYQALLAERNDMLATIKYAYEKAPFEGENEYILEKFGEWNGCRSDCAANNAPAEPPRDCNCGNARKAAK